MQTTATQGTIARLYLALRRKWPTLRPAQAWVLATRLATAKE
jgi:hypothetical protein